MTNRVEFTIDNIKLLGCRDYGYYNSGVFPKITSYFYKVMNKDNSIYTISTTHRLMAGDKIRASIKGESIFNNERQINLNRVTILEAVERPFGHNNF